ncbi:hypothetical protein Patl1_05406 [Pistacia atlantica]|uniref:Uncharacterized protein n=1 Tax=Pistacia atlantica TaxID=434234 RepID=A0ACC1BQQ2_9ROSI|nr:hypothetical protein Patl1_05406 [Pistacia atlantica]
MQAALSFSPSFLPIVTPTKTLALAGRITPRLQTPLCPSIKVTPATNDTSTVDYSSMTSVFPAEACETIGGDACDAEMYPEVKPKPEIQSSKAKTSSEPIDREYLDYSSPKTVFPGEACDDLGGEFCEPDYQEGVY